MPPEAGRLEVSSIKHGIKREWCLCDDIESVPRTCVNCACLTLYTTQEVQQMHAQKHVALTCSPPLEKSFNVNTHLEPHCRRYVRSLGPEFFGRQDTSGLSHPVPPFLACRVDPAGVRFHDPLPGSCGRHREGEGAQAQGGNVHVG